LDEGSFSFFGTIGVNLIFKRKLRLNFKNPKSKFLRENYCIYTL